MNRRGLLTSMFASALPLDAAFGSRRLGLSITSYTHRWRGKYSSFKVPPFQDVLDVMDHIHGLGIGSLQIPVSGWTLDLAKRVRQTCESYDMTIEGSVKLPVNESDVGRFERELRTAREAGASVFRTAMGGRRYEVFTRHSDFMAWKISAKKAIALAEPVARRLQVKIGVENHKDWEVHELATTLKMVASEHIGACVDTGNSIALLEDPMSVVRELAPYAVTVHLKDIAVVTHEEGFQMSEVPLGQGCLDLPQIIFTLLEANPKLRMNLEMITRDPLIIPCLSLPYWASFPEKPGVDMASLLSWVKQRSVGKLPKISGLSQLEVLNQEEARIQSCLVHAGQKLGFDHDQVQKPDGQNER